MARIPATFQKEFSAGMVTNLNTNLVPRGSVDLGMNVVFDEEIGSAVSRLGTSLINAQLVNNKTLLGLHWHEDDISGNSKLLGCLNNSGDTQSVVYDVDAGSVITGGTLWDSLTASTKARFVTFLGATMLVNGTDAPTSWVGTGNVINTGGAFDLANIPFSEPSLAIEWLDRIYLAGDTAEPDRVYHSGVAGSGAVSWTSGNGTVDIEPEDGGGGIKGFGKVPGYLLIFKERSMKRWNFDSAFPESLVQIGTPSQESVVMGGGLCAFYSASNKDAKGFYVTNGGRPIAISHDRARGIKKWIDAIPQSFDAEVAGYATERVFGWTIGDVTVDGFDYKNVVVRYNRILDQWSVASYPSEFRHFSNYVSSGSNRIVAGDDDGTVVEIDATDVFDDRSPATAAQVSIFWEVTLHAENFGYNQRKELSERIIVRTRNADGAKIEILADGAKTDHSGTIRSPVTNVDLPRRIMQIPIGKQVQGNEFVISIHGEVDGARAYISEVEFPNINVLNNY